MSKEPMLHLNNNENRNKISKPLNKLKYYSHIISNCSPRVLVPEFVVELLDLCNSVNNADLSRFSKLHSFCKIKTMHLNEFLNHLNYVKNTSHNLNIQNISQTDMTNNEGDSNIGTESGNECFNETKYKRNSAVNLKHFTKVDSKVGYDDDYCYETENSTKLTETGIFHISTEAFTLSPRNYLPQKFSVLRNGKKTYAHHCPFEYKLNRLKEIKYPFKKQISKLCTSVTHCSSDSNNKTANSETSEEYNTATSTKGNSFFSDCCCDCAKKKTACSETLKKILMVLLKRPIPTFASKTSTTNQNINKTGKIMLNH